MLVKAEKPVCSKCTTAVDAAVEFMAFATKRGEISRHRGAGRRVRLCRQCLRALALELDVLTAPRVRTRRKGA